MPGGFSILLYYYTHEGFVAINCGYCNSDWIIRNPKIDPSKYMDTSNNYLCCPICKESGHLLQVIQKDPNICNGSAFVFNTRIPVWKVISYMKKGFTDNKILEMFTDLWDDRLRSIKNYYYDNKQEIDKDISDYIDLNLYLE
jgi:uncharacterized protein (DUF433 family)